MLLSDIMDFPNEHLGMKKDQFPPMDTEMIKEKSQPKKNGFKTPTTTPGRDGDSQPLEKDQSTSVDTEMAEEKSQPQEKAKPEKKSTLKRKGKSQPKKMGFKNPAKILKQVDENLVDESQVNESQMDESKVDESQVDESLVDESQVDESQVDESPKKLVMDLEKDQTTPMDTETNPM